MVADAIRGAYRSDGAAEDTETFVEVGERMELGVSVHGDDDRLDQNRLYEIVAESEANIRPRI